LIEFAKLCNNGTSNDDGAGVGMKSMAKSMDRKLSPLKIVILYAVFGLSWILFSDLILSTITKDLAKYTTISIVKGWLYVVLTAALMYWLVSLYSKQRTQSEIALRKNEQRFRAFFEGNGSVMMLIDPDTGGIVDANWAAADYYGFSRATLCSMTIPDINMLPSEELTTQCRRAAVNQYNLSVVPHRLAGGEIRTVEVHTSPIEVHQKKLLFSIIHDITERKQVEASLQLARFTVDNVADAVYWMDCEAHIVDVNDTACNSLGYTREELLNLTVLDIDPDFTTAKWEKAWEALKSQGKITLETGHRTKDGRIVPVEVMANYLSFDGRELNCAFARDISQRKQVEEVLRASEERFRSLVESTGDWVWEVDKSGGYTYASPQILSLLGYAPEEVLGKKPFDLMPKDEAQRMSEIFNSVATDRKSIRNLENINLHKDGRLVVLETSGVPFYDPHGDFGGYRGIDRDITERKLVAERLEASLREKETLLRELYHRTKNNMQVISSLIDLQVFAVNDEETQNLFKETQNRIKTMALVHEKLYKSRDLSNLNLKDYMGDLADALFRSYHLSEDRISLNLAVEAISVSIDTAIPCGLIINELMSNSLKYAFPGDRRGTVSLAIHHSEQGEIDMRFSDNGVGLPKDLDFKNTKSLGLTLIRKLSEKQLKGTVEVTTEHPTEFHIRFKELLHTQRI
jgi:PAS domain S-box-containing protein